MEARVAPLSPPILSLGPSKLSVPDDHTYEIVASSTLHTVDLSRSIKTELLRPGAVQRWNAATRRLRYVIAGSHNLVHVLVVVALAVPRDAGRWIALATVPLGLPGCVATLLALRYDLLYVLLGTYDFWFFWAVTLVSCCCLAFLLNDLRACGIFFIAVGILICLVIDASISLSRVFSVSSAAAVLLGVAVVTIVHLRLVPGANELELKYNARTISLGDVIVNGIATLVILLARNAYRRKQAVRHATATNHASIRCITYRCPVKLVLLAARPVAPTAPRRRNLDRVSSVPRLLSSSHHKRQLTSSRVSELQLVPIEERIDGRRCLFGSRWPAVKSWSRAFRVAFWTAVVGTIFLLGVLFLLEVVLGHSYSTGLHTLSFISSIVLSGFVFWLLQPQLVRRLVHSFDWVFISLQLTVLHLCVCDAFAWDKRALLMLSAQLWIHLVLTMDALMPETRRQLGFHPVLPMAVIATYAGGATLFLGRFFLDTDWELFDRVLLDTAVGGRRVRVHVLPMIFSRLPMVITWSFRLLWRIATSKPGELILIQGAVAYDRPNATK